MTEVLRDPVWTFVGAALAILAIIVSIFLWAIQRRKKTLSYDVISSFSLLSVREEIEGKLKVLFEDNPVKNVHLFIIRLINTGNVPITSADYERPVEFSFGEDARILSSEVTATKPENLDVEAEEIDNFYVLLPLLLNPKDSITIKFLVSDYSGPIRIESRIIGVKGLEPLRDGQWRTPILVFAGMAIMAIGLYCGISSDSTLDAKPLTTQNKVGLTLLVTGYILIMAAIATNRRYMRAFRRMIRN